ncbi:hypothetical protein CVS47_02840 [Microbacterium lemovicicum]|uniref:Uncharacterized protein n=1 Tax=Microbacterium lemovicicum TaxID=1072463 RepID=A0A3S9WDM9_9MICO|nr:hypothetical protein CVS47_02840 [Microbacterium lemovicicum]
MSEVVREVWHRFRRDLCCAAGISAGSVSQPVSGSFFSSSWITRTVTGSATRQNARSHSNLECSDQRCRSRSPRCCIGVSCNSSRKAARGAPRGIESRPSYGPLCSPYGNSSYGPLRMPYRFAVRGLLGSPEERTTHVGRVRARVRALPGAGRSLRFGSPIESEISTSSAALASPSPLWGRRGDQPRDPASRWLRSPSWSLLCRLPPSLAGDEEFRAGRVGLLAGSREVGRLLRCVSARPPVHARGLAAGAAPVCVWERPDLGYCVHGVSVGARCSRCPHGTASKNERRS